MTLIDNYILLRKAIISLRKKLLVIPKNIRYFNDRNLYHGETEMLVHFNIIHALHM